MFHLPSSQETRWVTKEINSKTIKKSTNLGGAGPMVQHVSFEY